MKIIIICALLIFAAKVSAGHEVGNGGHVVACPKLPARLLDYVENAAPKEKTIPYREQVNAILTALAKVDPKLSHQYVRHWSKWDEQSEWLEGVDLTLIKDSEHIAIPTGCELKQLAIRRAKPIASQKRFAINKKIWDALSPTQQAGLVLHEIIYEHFFFLGEKDSRTARVYHAFIARMVDEPKTETEYRQLVRSLNIPLYR